MNKISMLIGLMGLLNACSADNAAKEPNDNFDKKQNNPMFSTFSTEGVNLVLSKSHYEIPALPESQTPEDPVDIRPPESPIALISRSIAKFDGENALIVFPLKQKQLYNLQQLGRLLTEEGIAYTQINDQTIQTDWTTTGRLDEDKNIRIRYQISQVETPQATALLVSILQTKRNEAIFTPTVSEKQRYTANRLNQFIATLTESYQKQLRDLDIQ